MKDTKEKESNILLTKFGAGALFLLGIIAIFFGGMEIFGGSGLTDILGLFALIIAAIGIYSIKVAINLWKTEKSSIKSPSDIIKTSGTKVIAAILLLEGIGEIYEGILNGPLNSHYHPAIWVTTTKVLVGLVTIFASVKLFLLKKLGFKLALIILALNIGFLCYGAVDALQMSQEDVGELFSATGLATFLGVIALFHVSFLMFLLFAFKKSNIPTDN